MALTLRRASSGPRTPRQALAWLAVATSLVLGALGWLGWRVVNQDRALERLRIRERLEAAADLVAGRLLTRLSEVHGRLAPIAALDHAEAVSAAGRQADDLGPGALILIAEPDRIESFPADGLLYRPPAATPASIPEDMFAEVDELEFSERNHAAAIARLRVLSASGDPQIRSATLVRLARNLRKAGSTGRALAVYDELAELGGTPVATGIPAALFAHYARCELFELDRATDRLRAEAAILARELGLGRWGIDRSTYAFYAAAAAKWSDRPAGSDAAAGPGDRSRLALASAVESAWELWQRAPAEAASGPRERTLWIDDEPVLLLLVPGANRLVALVAGRRHLETAWLGDLGPLVERQRIRFALADPTGRPIFDQADDESPGLVIRANAETRLPWTLRVSSADPSEDLGQLSARRRLLLVELGLVGLVVIAGAYFIGRGITRELSAARLQSDFVSAVSHEFRSPLTVVRQLTELLLSDRAGQSATERTQVLSLVAHEADRLQRLIDNLLDFGSIEAGAKSYRRERLEAISLVRETVEQFKRSTDDRDGRIEVIAGEELSWVRADPEAIGRALWNLVDNAVKYSPRGSIVRVEVVRKAGMLEIHVRDNGLGVAPAERKLIFRRFFRGSATAASGAKGTGIGLAMVKHIAEEHDGRIRVESTLGKGSTFTLSLPVED